MQNCHVRKTRGKRSDSEKSIPTYSTKEEELAYITLLVVGIGIYWVGGGCAADGGGGGGGGC